MPTIRSIAILIVLSIPGFASDRTKLQSMVQGQFCKVDGNLSKDLHVSAEIEMGIKRDLTSKEIDEKDQDPAWRQDYFSDWPPVKKVLIKVNGEEVLIPQSAFQDLYDVTKIEISTRKGHIHLWIGGGDASGSFSATFKIIPSLRIKGKYRVSERTLRHGEFPDEVWENTNYRNTIWDDPNM